MLSHRSSALRLLAGLAVVGVPVAYLLRPYYWWSIDWDHSVLDHVPGPLGDLLLGFGAYWIVERVHTRKPPALVGHPTTHWMVVAVALGVAVAIANQAIRMAYQNVSGLWGEETDFIGPSVAALKRVLDASSIGALLGFVFVLTLGAASEELVFRGVLQPLLRDAIGRIRWAIGLTSLVFAGLHWRNGWTGMIFAFLLGLLCGYLAARRRSVLLPTVCHFSANAATTGLLMLRANEA